MHRKRWISAVELVLASALIIYAFVGISLPSDEWNNWASYSIPATFAGVPTYAVKPISFNAVINITAQGSLSVNNPINVDVLVYDVNDSNFLQDYRGISFTWCYPLTDTYSSTGVLESCFLPLVSHGNGTYVAKGTVKWLQDGPSYLFLVPTVPGFVLNNEENLGQYESVGLTITTVSDTLSENFNFLILRLTYILAGFALLTLHPVLEAALLPHEDPKKRPEPEKEQSRLVETR